MQDPYYCGLGEAKGFMICAVDSYNHYCIPVLMCSSISANLLTFTNFCKQHS